VIEQRQPLSSFPEITGNFPAPALFLGWMSAAIELAASAQ
jgi:hypothetical protein